MIASDRRGKLPEQMLVQSNAGLETFEREIFVRRVGFAVGGGEAETLFNKHADRIECSYANAHAAFNENKAYGSGH